MQKLTRDDLYSLEQYSTVRSEFRDKVLAHKKHRRIELGTNAALYFEDRLTMQYQIQEMLRIERIFEAECINDELEAYNPLIPDGTNWKATFMVEFPDAEERRAMLGQLVDIENKVFVQVGEFDRVYAIADEDLEQLRADEGARRLMLGDDVEQLLSLLDAAGRNVDAEERLRRRIVLGVVEEEGSVLQMPAGEDLGTGVDVGLRVATIDTHGV